ncbi:hypothetical protein PIB30_009766 [Stylosanthes scabra]|uniref:Uncharacterized protein n=1 Tax=Stylosanthes scabra TaxID=79078 RepID=A0ABU6X614_9FABA|nr:hypothetical protein [Stylosanthes scabra]
MSTSEIVEELQLREVNRLRRRQNRREDRGRNLADDSNNNNRDYLSSNSRLGWREYLRSAWRRVFEMSPSLHVVLLAICLIILYHLVQIISTAKEFDFPHADKPLLNLGEALNVLFDEMLITSAFYVFYFLTWLLVSPVQLEVQLIVLIILHLTYLYYFSVLIRACSGVYVDLGFKLPLVLFCIVGALAIASLCVLFTLLMGYIGWRQAGGTQRTIDIRLADLVRFIPH